MVSYDWARFERQVSVWPRPSYSLETILSVGGICVDQAYFSMGVAHAMGVPAMVFTGQGGDGRHAWFAFLDGDSGWRLDVGRGEDARLVSGLALDPQTWEPLSEHELRFLSERFLSSPRAVEARRLAAMALALYDAGRVEEALRFARAAIALERRTLNAWRLLTFHVRKAPVRDRVQVLSEAARSFSAYPDLELEFAGELAAVWREAGEGSRADAEELRLLRRNQAERPDLSARIASGRMRRYLDPFQPDAAAQNFERLLAMFGEKGGMAVFDLLVGPYLQAATRARDAKAASRALLIARRELRPPEGSQLDLELKALEASVRGQRR
jgi:tetratricopeptide (TPR) repeat protein